MDTRRTILIACCVASAASTAMAQYKVTDPTGGVTYTDRLPAQADRQRVQSLGLAGAIASPVDALPYELRQPARQFAVTLYTMPGCSACDNGRYYLRKRGIPFAEKSIASGADREAFEKLNLGSEVPVLRIGQQVLRNFSEAAWAADLDLAGYPATSKLPSSYNGWEPSSLADAAPAAAASAPAARAQAPARPATPPSAGDANPTGIRF